MAKATGLAHIGIFVSDIQESKEFYKNILGMDITFECVFEDTDNTYTIAFAKIGDLTFELVQPKFRDDKVDGVIDHIAFAVDDLEGMMDILKEKGIEFETKEPAFFAGMLENGSKWIFFRGPDAEHIELTQVL